MTNEERDDFCQALAGLFYPPDEDLIGQIHEGNLHSFFGKYVRAMEGEEQASNGFLMKGTSETLRRDLKNEYERLFSGLGNGSVSLVESCYKPWTRDPSCSLPFASETGLLMGDSAVHLLEIYRKCDLEIDEAFRGCPDHVAMELEFLSCLYRWTTEGEVRRFIEDHLDWIPRLREECRRLEPHPFYGSAVDALDLFLSRERERLKVEGNGKKTVH
jgi:putative dimethyl sulfoxide reductase chaperone